MIYKRLLVLLDGSKLSETVFSYARELAGRLNLDLHLLHVCTPEEAEQLPMRQAYVEHMADMLKAQSEEVRQKAGSVAGDKAIQARSHVAVGYPAEEILKYADENNIDLVMLSNHGRSGIRRWGLGSVADKVIHETKVPVWLVPAQLREEVIYDTLPKRPLLVPLDGSQLAESVLPHVEALAKQRGAVAESDIVLVNVGQPTPSRRSDVEYMGEKISGFKRTTEIYLNKIAREQQTKGLTVRVEQLVGDPAEEIIRYAAEIHPQLIAMSTHGRSGFSRVVFASVTENVLRRLMKTPLFLIRPTPPTAQ